MAPPLLTAEPRTQTLVFPSDEKRLATHRGAISSKETSSSPLRPQQKMQKKNTQAKRRGKPAPAVLGESQVPAGKCHLDETACGVTDCAEDANSSGRPTVAESPALEKRKIPSHREPFCGGTESSAPVEVWCTHAPSNT